VLAEYLSWRWCLYVNAIFAAALAGAVPLIRNQPRNPGARLDVPGSLLAAAGLVGIADRVRGTAYLGALIAGIGLIGTFLLVTYCLQGVLGFSPLRAGLAFLPFIAGVVAAANFVSNKGLERFGTKRVVPA
jgi:MFS family permease